MTQVTILGTGLIGASIGLALHANPEVVDVEVVGFDREQLNAREARKIGAVDRTERYLEDAVRGANLIVLAAPVLANHRLLEQIAPFVERGAVVTDTGSTKAATIATAREHLPEGVSFIGGHPMAGKTEVGPSQADAELFRDARWVVVAPPWASEAAVRTVFSLAEAVGARPMIMDAEEHDAYVAAISHMPMVAAHVMFNLARRSEAWPELSLLAAGGFKSSTRLTGTDPSMAYDILATNRDQTVHWLDRYIEELREMRDRLKDSDREALYTQIAQGELDYSAFMLGAVGRKEDTRVASEADQFDFSALLIGQMAKDKISELTADSEERIRKAELERRLKRDLD
jgi:prephenate dehydrogenase